MSTTNVEDDRMAEKEPITEEGRAKAGERKTGGDTHRKKSIRDKMNEARNQSKGNVDFVATIFSLIVSSVVGLIALALANLVSVAQIVIGAIYIHDCTLRSGIPIILIIVGSVGVLESLCEGANKRIDSKRNTDGESNHNLTQLQKNFRVIVNALRLIAFASFIAWCVLVYGSGKPDYDNRDSDSYCDPVLYLFAFWLLNIYFIFLGLALFFCCCCFCFALKGGD